VSMDVCIIGVTHLTSRESVAQVALRPVFYIQPVLPQIAQTPLAPWTNTRQDHSQAWIRGFTTCVLGERISFFSCYIPVSPTLFSSLSMTHVPVPESSGRRMTWEGWACCSRTYILRRHEVRIPGCSHQNRLHRRGMSFSNRKVSIPISKIIIQHRVVRKSPTATTPKNVFFYMPFISTCFRSDFRRLSDADFAMFG